MKTKSGEFYPFARYAGVGIDLSTNFSKSISSSAYAAKPGELEPLLELSFSGEDQVLLQVSIYFSALLHGLSFPIFLTLLTLGAASYGEFELRRKFGRYYCLNEVLPTGLYKPKAAPAEIHDEKTQEEISLSYSHYILNLLASPWVFLAYVARKVTNLVKSKAFISFIFNTSFLFVNLTHLFYLGNLFSEPDMKVVNCVKKMADFDFISTKLAIITFFLGYYC